jgi:hypothetical protein
LKTIQARTTVSSGVEYQMRERYLVFGVEVLADAFPVFQGTMVSPDLTCLLCNTAVVVDFVFRKWNNESINI